MSSASAIHGWRLDIFDEVTATLQDIRAAASNAEVYVVGYPSPVSSSTGDCGSLDLWGSVANRRITRLERSWIDTQFMPYLNSVIASAAKKAGVRYVDISRALDGHAICSAEPHAHGITFGDDTMKILNAASFHPSDKGQHDMYVAVTEAEKNIGRQLVRNPVPDNTVEPPPVPGAAGTGVVASAFELGIGGLAPFESTKRIAQDGLVRLTGHDFLPSSIVEGTLYSTEIDLGTVRADANGEVSQCLTRAHSEGLLNPECITSRLAAHGRLGRSQTGTGDAVCRGRPNGRRRGHDL